jgi:RNA polymerase sigma-70 factor, ECF subfamily
MSGLIKQGRVEKVILRRVWSHRTVMGERDLSVARAAYGDGPAARARSGSTPSPSSSSTASGAGVAAVAAAPSVLGGSAFAERATAERASAERVGEDGLGAESAGADRPRLTALPAWSSDDMRRRVHELVNEYMDFVWRSLRRLGVADADCDDGCQRVWVVLAQKLESIEPTKVRSFIFSIVVRVASEMRRNYRRHQHVEFDELCVEPGRPDAEGLVEQQRVRQLLDQILAGLSWDLRTVFVMYEIEGMSSPEIAEVLGISRGTVASRLRLGREAFQRSLQRHRARARGDNASLHATAPSSRSPSSKPPTVRPPLSRPPLSRPPLIKPPLIKPPFIKPPGARS